ncbi:MAG: tocopherol cyclase family protein [Solirubrobacteraceae bacterium MAG38_C4-C5]|nr:tocopherol cyclase family protein [Candidatus Siliceabacter maunaloa]
MRSAYRARGADPPLGDLRAHHAVAFEGYFWRVTDPGEGGVVIALLGVCRDANGRSWATAALAGHPGGVVRRATLDSAAGDPARLAVCGATADGGAWVRADARQVTFALGDDAHLALEVERPVRWPRRALGGIGPAQLVPGLSQYWHPWLLDGVARGSARLGERTWNLDGARVYAEKNWGGGGFPAAWWWGQAHGFAREDATVAFAGGRAGLGPLRLTATSVVVRAGREVVRLTRPPGLLRVDVGPGRWRIAGRTGRHTLELEGAAAPADAQRLPVPLPAQRRELPEGSAQHLAGELGVLLRRGRRTILDDTSSLAGLELGRGG